MSRTLTRRPALLVAVCILAAALTGMLLGRVTISGAATNSGERAVVTTITPYRVLDTRGAPFGPIGTTPAGAVPVAPIGAAQTLTLQIGGTGGATGVPADATGAVINITAVNCTADSFITVYPNGAAQPNASNLNPFPGRITHNSAVVDLPANGRVNIFNNAGTCDLAMDVTGFSVDHGHDDRLGSGSNAVTQTGFEVILTTNNATATIIENGPMRLFARCIVNQGGNDRMEIVAISTTPWFEDDSATPRAANTEVIIDSDSAPTGTTDITTGDVEVLGMFDATGRFIGATGEDFIYGVNVFGNRCYARGVVETMPNVR